MKVSLFSKRHWLVWGGGGLGVGGGYAVLPYFKIHLLICWGNLGVGCVCVGWGLYIFTMLQETLNVVRRGYSQLAVVIRGG